MLIGETRRAISRSTDPTVKTKSLRTATHMFTRNGYPKQFVKSVIKRTVRTELRREDPKKYVYLKLPFINEDLRRRAFAIARRSDIENVRFYFENGKSLSIIFMPPKEKQSCPKDCHTCKLSLKTNRCLVKHTVYRMNCSHCGSVYIGETRRSTGSRVKEHLRMKKQTVYIHLRSHNIDPQIGSPVNWEILQSNIKNYDERRTIEVLEIRKHSENIKKQLCW